MTAFVVISPDDLEALVERAVTKALGAEMKEQFGQAQIVPVPEWLSIPDYARHVGKSESTINRWIAQGIIETRMEGAARMVRVQSNR